MISSLTKRGKKKCLTDGLGKKKMNKFYLKSMLDMKVQAYHHFLFINSPSNRKHM